jgi:hypothetical protein
LFAVVKAHRGGDEAIVQASRLSEEETMRRLGAVVKALRGGDDALVRRLGGGYRLLCFVKALGGGDDAKGCGMLCFVKAHGGGDDAKGSCFDGSEEAVDWTTARRRLSLRLMQSMPWEDRCLLGDDTLAFTRGTVNQL